MSLSNTQLALITKARIGGSSELAVSLDDATCSYLVGLIVRDLDLAPDFPEIPHNLPSFFSSSGLQTLRLEDVSFQNVFERLVELRKDADTYFYCLATLHKARLKYERILQFQPIPTIDQVGPRGLLQYGSLAPESLAGFLFWRKWLFDIDNRAGQETGYVFEPIIAYAIGGVPFSAKKSPVRRSDTPTKGRQVDCIREQRAYEIKIRVTIAASGQGRWKEELAFSKDCQNSGYIPVLIVLDPTPNPKLEELRKAFIDADGEVYIGQNAWEHLATVAGTTMSRFIQLYVHEPIQSLLHNVPDQLPDMKLQMSSEHIIITVGHDTVTVLRGKEENTRVELDEMPEDVD